MMERAWIELDEAALRHNVNTLRALLPPGCRLMPAVKANAYGHGALPIARALNSMGIDAFCVATASEGAELRENGVHGEILVLGYTPPAQFPLLCRCRLSQTLLSFDYAKVLSASGEEITAHIAIDTGMHRLGIPWDAANPLDGLFDLPHLRIAGAFTHLCADTTLSPEDRTFTQTQNRRFQAAIHRLKTRGHSIPSVHILASYGLLNYPELGGDYARVGIALYGALSGKEDHCAAGLEPVLSLKARVVHVQALRRGERAGYDLKFTAQRDSRIATLSIGYADGLPRSLSCGAGGVLLRGRRAPIIGRICMDQTLVDATGIPDVAPGDTAVLIGKDGGLQITAADLAKQAGTISNEILSRLGARLERRLRI